LKRAHSLTWQDGYLTGIADFIHALIFVFPDQHTGVKSNHDDDKQVESAADQVKDPIRYRKRVQAVPFSGIERQS